MSFRIHAAGSNNFRYTRDNCVDDDIFDAAELLSALQDLEQSPGRLVPTVGTAISAGVGYFLPSATNNVVRAVAQLESLHTLQTAFASLAVAANRGFIDTFARQTRRLRIEDVFVSARYNFVGEDYPTTRFMRTILPILRQTEMNNFGVLLQLSRVLSLYSDHIGDSNNPMLLVNLSKTTNF